MSTETVVLSRETTKRLIKDIREMIKNPFLLIDKRKRTYYYKQSSSRIYIKYLQ